MDYRKQLAIEAVTVGATFVPWSYMVSGFVRKVPALARYDPWISVFISGAGYHLIAEATGLNKWYLFNSAASMMSMAEMGEYLKPGANVEKKCGLKWCGE